MVGELRLRQIEESERYRTRDNVPYTLVAPLRCFDLSGDHEPAAQACCDPEGWSQAIGMLEAIADSGRQSGQAKAVYVFGVEGNERVAKIGVSANPMKRLSELQCGHYRRLFLHAIVFSPKRNAIAIEQGVLRLAEEAESRLMGEWIELSPEGVLTEALAYAHRQEIPVVDGRTWFADMVCRTRDIARSQKMRRAA